ncbi:MAG: DUF1501 domain-containing protein [Alphaproteobacteria bacterium]|nr:DUF1501 domain-containing protein [Alphaproteobacteria bacterium]MBT4711291.1 DUF1501 domain-containing protein [Alphaproteobacteria bacterium]
MNRREFLTSAALAPLVTLPFVGSAHAAARWDRTVILVELSGGNDGLNTVVPYTDSGYYSLRPNIAVAKETVLQLDERLGLAKELEPIMPLWNQGNLAVALGVGYPEPNLSHFRGIEIWDTATDSSDFAQSGWIGQLYEGVEAPPAEFAADGMVFGRGVFGPLKAPGRRVMVLQNIGQLDAAALLPSIAPAPGMEGGMAVDPNPLAHVLGVQQDFKSGAAAILAKGVENVDAKASFPEGNFGLQMEMAAKMIAGGVQVPVIKVTLGGFDTHAAQLDEHPLLHAELAAGLRGFSDSMKAHGMWDDVLVMTYAEFGRRPKENGSGGTDHGTSAPHFLMGGRVKGGLYGEQPPLDALVNRDNLQHRLHFRSLYATVAQEWWGMDASFLNAAPLGAIA